MYKILTEDRKLVLMGYECLLRDAIPNARYNHEVANKITGLRGNLKLGTDIEYSYEEEIKELIRKLY